MGTPMLCDKLDKAQLPFFINLAGKDWVAEEKYDGDRIRLRVKDGVVTLTNRRGAVVTERYPEVLDVKGDFFLDGEMCVIDENDVSQFNTGIAYRSHCKTYESIRNSSEQYPVTYVVFDILEQNGRDLRNVKYSDRRMILEGLGLNHKHIRLSEKDDDIVRLWKKVTAKNGEGIILKNVNSSYQENKRSVAWKKVKDIKEVDLTFTKFETHNMGITLESDDGIRCVVNGRQSQEVVECFNLNGGVIGTINHLGKTDAGKYRQPTWKKLVGGKND